MRHRTWIVLCIVLLAACNAWWTAPEAENAVLRWGTSFGMCAGYCREDLAVDSMHVRLTRSAWRAELPQSVAQRPFDGDSLARLLRAIDIDALRALQPVYGCPDCADGGAEYVELQTATFTKRVEYEFGREPEQLRALVRELRALRATFPTP